MFVYAGWLCRAEDDVMGGVPVHRCGPAANRQFVDLMNDVAGLPTLEHVSEAAMSASTSADDVHNGDVQRWRTLIAATGAAEWIEQLIDGRLTHTLGRAA